MRMYVARSDAEPRAANICSTRSSVNGRPAASNAASTTCLSSFSSIVLIVRSAALYAIFGQFFGAGCRLRGADVNRAERVGLHDVDQRLLDEFQDREERHRDTDATLARIEQAL